MSISSSIIVATRNRPDDIANFLDSLEQQTVKPNEIIIVDSSDKILCEYPSFLEHFSAKKFPNIRLIYKHTKPGLTYQKNIGVKAASCEIIYFFDDDIILEKNYLQDINKIFEENPIYAGGMGDISNIPPQKNISAFLSRFLKKIFMLPSVYSSGKFTLSGMPQHSYGTNKFKEVEVLGGGLTAYRSWVFKKNLFDENLKNYAFMEDCDFSRRVSYKHPLFYNPKAKLKHLESPVARDKLEINRAMFIRNYSYIFFKNFYPKNKLKVIAYFWSIIGLFAEAIFYRKNKSYLKGYTLGLIGFWKNKLKK